MKAQRLFALVLALGSGTSSYIAWGQAAKNPAPDVAVTLPPQPADEKTASDVREIMARAVNNALTPGKFTVLVDLLAKPNRDKLQENPSDKPDPGDKLNRIIAQFRTDFHDKYHEDFDFRAEFLKQVPVRMGPNAKTLTVPLEDTKPAGKSTEAPPTTMPSTAPLASGPTLILVNEGQGGANGRPEGALWRINIPNEISAKQLKDNLTRHLQKLDDAKSTWDKDPNMTARAAASEIFQALTDSSLATDE